MVTTARGACRLRGVTARAHVRRRGWGKLAGGVKWPPPPVRHLTKVNEMTVVSGHLSSLEVTRSKISKSSNQKREFQPKTVTSTSVLKIV